MKSIILLCILSIVLLPSCFTSVAQYSNFPQTSEQIDFEEVTTVNQYKSPLWTKQAINEYYLEVPIMPDSVLIQAIVKAMQFEGYKVHIADFAVNKVVAERGMRANEWSTMAAAYFRNTKDKSQIYFRCQITQDATGGWRENRAKKIAKTLTKEC